MYKLYDSEGGYIDSFPSWKQADNFRFVKGNNLNWRIKNENYKEISGGRF